MNNVYKGVCWIFVLCITIFFVEYSDSEEIEKSIKLSMNDEFLSCDEEKIMFDIHKIDDDGRVGPDNGKVSIDYEFCIPYEDMALAEVRSIGVDLQCEKGMSGRIGCAGYEYLCLGNTGSEDFKIILCSLARLDYIKRIQQNFWE